MKPKLYIDDIIKEVRTIREQLAALHDYNVRTLFREAKKRQKKSKRKVVKLAPRLLKTAEKNGAHTI